MAKAKKKKAGQQKVRDARERVDGGIAPEANTPSDSPIERVTEKPGADLWRRRQGQQAVVLTVETFGLSPDDRYRMPSRSHDGPDLMNCTPKELYNGHRGASIELMLALHEGDIDDCDRLFRQQQRIAAELARRCLEGEATVEIVETSPRVFEDGDLIELVKSYRETP